MSCPAVALSDAREKGLAEAMPQPARDGISPQGHDSMNEAQDNRVLWTPQRWLIAECYLRRLIDVHDFKRRELIVLHVVLMRSYGLGRPRALFERLEDLHACTRISRGNVSEVLNGLRRALVLDVRPQKWYGINPNAKAWKVVPRLDLAPLMEQIELLVPDADLRDGMDAAFLDDPAQFLGLDGLPARGAGAVSAVRQTRSTQARDSRPGVLSGCCESSGAERSFEPGGSRPRAGYHAAVGESVGESVGNSPLLSMSVPKSGTRDAFPNRERCVNHNKDGPGAVGSRIGNADPPLKTLNSLESQRSAVYSSKTADLLTAELSQDARKLRRELEELVGKSDWVNWGGAWTNALKLQPAVVERVIACYRQEAIERQKTAQPPIRHPGGWMWDNFKRWR